MDVFGSLSIAQLWVGVALGASMLAVEVVAFVDCLRHRPDAFDAAGKLTKNKWTIITTISMVLGFYTVTNPIGIFGIVGFVAASVYLVDVRPALREMVSGRSQSSSQGPYGPW